MRLWECEVMSVRVYVCVEVIRMYVCMYLCCLWQAKTMRQELLNTFDNSEIIFMRKVRHEISQQSYDIRNAYVWDIMYVHITKPSYKYKD